MLVLSRACPFSSFSHPPHKDFSGTFCSISVQLLWSDFSFDARNVPASESTQQQKETPQLIYIQYPLLAVIAYPLLLQMWLLNINVHLLIFNVRGVGRETKVTTSGSEMKLVTVMVQPTRYQTKTLFQWRRHADRAAAVYSLILWALPERQNIDDEALIGLTKYLYGRSVETRLALSFVLNPVLK